MPTGTVAFDVIGTLFSLDRIRRELVELGAPPSALDLWIAQALRDAFALSLAGGYTAFDEVLGAALPRALLRFGVDPTARQVLRVMSAMSELELADDADGACRRLREDGWRLLALTNGGEDATRALLRRAGVEPLFEAVLSCDKVRKTKPAPEVYAMARERAEGDLWLVASHAWDVMGASRAGLRTAWICRMERRYLSVFPKADVEVSEIHEAADAIMRLGVTRV